LVQTVVQSVPLTVSRERTMAEKYMCTGCYRTEGNDNGADYCDECASYKYFAWVEDDGDEYFE
jgi:methionyl-tRNA synthetase